MSEAVNPSAPVEFEIEGVTLVYDYDQLVLSQMKLAEAVYQYQADLQKRPPRSLKEKIELGAADYNQVVLSYILLKRQKDGTLQRFKGGETQRPILDLVNNMSSRDAKKADGVINDFFIKQGQYTLALLVQSRYSMQYSLAAAEFGRAMLQTNSEPSSSNEPESIEQSTTEASGSEESGNA